MPCDLSETLFAQWQAVFASRIGRPQTELAQIADYRAFCRVFDDDADFDRAAQRVYERWASWDAWPAPIEFESARAALRRVPDAEITATLRQIDQSRLLAPPATGGSPTRDAALDAFGADWRARLAHCAPDALRAEALAAKQAGGADPWLTNERRAALFPPEPPRAPDAPPTPPTLEQQIDADADRALGEASHV